MSPLPVRSLAAGCPARACRRRAGAGVRRVSAASGYHACCLRGCHPRRRRMSAVPGSSRPGISGYQCRRFSSWPSSLPFSWFSFSGLAALRPCAFRCGVLVAAWRCRAARSGCSSCRGGLPATASFSLLPSLYPLACRRRTATSASPRNRASGVPCASEPASSALSCRSPPARRLCVPASTRAPRAPPPLLRARSSRRRSRAGLPGRPGRAAHRNVVSRAPSLRRE